MHLPNGHHAYIFPLLFIQIRDDLLISNANIGCFEIPKFIMRMKYKNQGKIRKISKAGGNCRLYNSSNPSWALIKRAQF